MFENTRETLSKFNCWGLLKTATSVKIVSLIMMFIFMGDFIINFCITKKLGYNFVEFIIMTGLITCLLIGIIKRKKEFLNIFFLLFVYVMSVVAYYTITIICSVILLFQADDEDNILSFRKKIQNSVFNINDEKYSNDEIIRGIRIYSVVVIVYGVLFMLISIAYFIATKNFADNLVREIEEEQKVRAKEDKKIGEKY